MNKYGGVLVIGEICESTIHQVTYELLGKGRELADQLGCSLDVLLLGMEIDSPQEANHYGADRVYLMKSPSFSYPEEVLYKLNITKFIEAHHPAIVLVGATNFGRSLAPRVAASLQTGLTADCTSLEIGEDNQLIQIRPAFSDNILAHITSRKFPQMATVRHGEFELPKVDTKRNSKVIEISPYVEKYDKTQVLEGVKSKVLDITKAEVIVACGRGIKAVEDFSLIQQLADCLGGQVGFSRALVDAGMVDATHQIGYSGVRVRPKLYFACGISGAPQHLAGMKDSERIIGINRDPSAPIFNVCDLGIVGDLYEVIPQLIKELEVKA
jgi:electron transfer flavoprotein alpha subunit